MIQPLTYKTLLDAMNVPADSEHVLSPDAPFFASDDADDTDNALIARQALILYNGQLVTFLWNMAAQIDRHNAGSGFAQEEWGTKPMNFLQKLGFSEVEAARLCWSAQIRTRTVATAIWGEHWNYFALPVKP